MSQARDLDDDALQVVIEQEMPEVRKSNAWVPSFLSLLGDERQLLVVSVAGWTLLRASLVAQRAEVNRSAFDLDPSREHITEVCMLE